MFRILIIFLTLVSFSVKAQQPQLKGSLAGFLKENIIYPPYSRFHCIQGIVKVGFKLNAKGEVYYAALTNSVGADLDEEALRLIKMSSGKWQVPTSHDTTTLIVVPVNFSLTGYDCERASKTEIALAIKNYKDEQELKYFIMNFYRNKENGVFKPGDELKIIALKNEIGIDDTYLENRIEMGQKKIKQGDVNGACEDFKFVKYMGSDKANDLLLKYCK